MNLTISHNHGFCPYPPRRGRGQNYHQTAPKAVGFLCKYEYIECSNRLIDCLPVEPTIRVFVPPPPKVWVTGLVLDNTTDLLNPRYMLLDEMYKRFKSILTLQDFSYLCWWCVCI